MFTYEEALDYLYSFVDYGSLRTYQYSAETFDLRRMVDLLARLGDPQRRYPVLHLAGTKGKGSVSAMCASALRAAGYHTGFYTSPHLRDFCERIQVNGELIPRPLLAELVDGLRPVVEQVPGLTTFELNTALAFLYFQQTNVDVAVVEVGLGGRLDATNVVNPLAAVITSLSYDHMHLLGHTLTEIAGEKAGIIKPGVPVVSAPQAPEAMAVLERVARERGAPLTVVGRDWLFTPLKHSLDDQTFAVWSRQEQDQLDTLHAQGHMVEWVPLKLEIPLLGRHQVENAAVAYAALMALRTRGLPLPEDAIRAGLRSVVWPGRFEILHRRPYLVVDGAHNHDSANKLAAAVQDYLPGRPVTLLFGASSDKDVAGMFDALLPHVTRVYLVQAVHPRAWEPDELARLASERGTQAEVVGSVAQALAQAVARSQPEEVILACGSLFVVAEVQAAWAGRAALPMTAPSAPPYALKPSVDLLERGE